MSDPQQKARPGARSGLDSGDDAAEKIYRRLLARRRRWANADLVIDDVALNGPDEASAPASADTARPPGAVPGSSASRPASAAAAEAAADPDQHADTDAGTAPQAGARPQPGSRSDTAGRRGRSGPYAAAAGAAADAGQGFELSQWQPRSHTVRFIKEHPALALAIGIPALVLLTRKGAGRRALRYASSPAGMARIRQISTVVTALGLLEKNRR